MGVGVPGSLGGYGDYYGDYLFHFEKEEMVVEGL